MPDDRFLHKRLGHSGKVNSLNDFEFRVWVQYQLSADDCGVMHAVAIAFQADNITLAARQARTIQRAIGRLVSVGLLSVFEHQGTLYLYQRDWQDFQRIRFPRSTIRPCPPEEVLMECTPLTRALFRSRHGETAEKLRNNLGETSERLRRNFGTTSEKLRSDSGETSEIVPSCARARMANGLRLTANGSEVLSSEKEKPENPEPEQKSGRQGSGAFGIGGLPRDHLRHAACGRVCLHETQFGQFIGKLGGERQAAELEVRRWAMSVLSDWERPPKLDISIGGNNFQFWDTRWEEWKGAAVKVNADDAMWDAIVRAGPSVRP